MIASFSKLDYSLKLLVLNILSNSLTLAFFFDDFEMIKLNVCDCPSRMLFNKCTLKIEVSKYYLKVPN